MLEEVQRVAEQDGVVSLAVVESGRTGIDVGLLAAIDFFGLAERLTAFPEFDDEGIARLSHGACAPVASYEECVFIDPGSILFGFGQDEAFFDELTGLQIELAEGFSIFASSGELDEAEA